MRPKPLMPTRTVMWEFLLGGACLRGMWCQVTRCIRLDCSGHVRCCAAVRAAPHQDRPRRARRQRATSRCATRTATPRPRRRDATSSAVATERCRPPVQPMATVRYERPSFSYCGSNDARRSSRRSTKSDPAAVSSTWSRTFGSWPVSGRRSGYPVRVRQETHVHHHVGVEWQAVFEPEALDGDLQPRIRRRPRTRGRPGPSAGAR